ncbi:MAG: DegT/DnrJ/EryC1/StrS family aminotransferase [Eubacterium sp.]|nr:DegT/DnrJ/EryC1/StrS family aminotransferase [Eubacterium sp.]
MSIFFSPPDMTEKESEAVIEVLKSGWITTGPKAKEFEEKIASYCGTAKAAALNSGTASMELTYRLLGIGEGDEVITTAYTYTATASAICHVGAKPVLVDVSGDEAGTVSPYEIDYEAVAAAITPKTKAITAVDIGGVMCDYDRLLQIAKDKQDMFVPGENNFQKDLGRIAIVADAAHSFGASRNGVKSGAAADFTCFSFHAVKNLTTAEGGAVTWKSIVGIDDEDIYKLFMLMSLHGQSKDALEKNKTGSWEYDIVFPGYKCNLTDVHAAIGLVQFDRFGELEAKRKHIIELYDKGIEEINKKLGKDRSAERILPVRTLKHFGDNYASSGHLYMLRIGAVTDRERRELIDEMAKSDVPTNVHYKPLPMMTAYKAMGYKKDDYPKAFELSRNEVTLPLHTLLTDEDVKKILDVLYDSLMLIRF